jgi:hypothetical protein
VSNRASLVEVLQRCVRGDDVAAIAAARSEHLDGLAELAIEHGVAGIVYQHLGQLSALDLEVRRLLGAAVLQNRINHEHIASDVRYLAGVFEPLSAPWLIVKGPAVAATLYSPPDLRAAGDIDVLVAPEQFARAVSLLELAGHEIDDTNWPLVRRLTAGQLHVSLPNGTPLDLHWHLLFTADERLRYPLATRDLIERRRTATIAGTELLTLDPVDTLVHLCFHAANEGADRLGWLSDIARAAAVPRLDWDAVIARTTAWRMQLPVATVLQRTAQQLGAPIPREVPAQLAPFPWRAMMTSVDRVFPVGRVPRRLGNPASLLTKSSAVAGTPVRSAAAAVSGLARRALSAAQTRDATRIDRANRGDTEASLAYKAEFNAADRDAYFAAVRAAGGTD